MSIVSFHRATRGQVFVVVQAVEVGLKKGCQLDSCHPPDVLLRLKLLKSRKPPRESTGVSTATSHSSQEAPVETVPGALQVVFSAWAAGFGEAVFPKFVTLLWGATGTSPAKDWSRCCGSSCMISRGRTTTKTSSRPT